MRASWISRSRSRALALALCIGLVATFAATSAATTAGHSAAPARAKAEEAETKVCDGCTPPLVYQGGRVMGTTTRAGEVTVMPIFWGTTASFPGTYRAIIDRYLHDVAVASGGTDNVYSVNTEYSERVSGVTHPIQYVMHFGGELDDLNALPANGCAPAASYSRCVTDAQLRTQLNTFLTQKALTADRAHFYPVFLPPGVEGQDSDGSTSASGWCGYHNAFTPSAGRLIVYGHEPYTTLDGCGTGQAPNGNQFADSAISVLSHEINESITDPTAPPGWIDSPGGNEIADECAGNFGDPIDSTDPNNPDSTKYNQVINGDGYYTQEEFSNTDFNSGTLRGCVQRKDDVGATAATAQAVPSAAPGATTNAAAKPKNDIAVDANDYTLPADGTSTTQVTVDIDDAGGNPVANDRVVFTTASQNIGPQVCGKLSALSGRTDADGHLEVTYRASTDNVDCDIVATEAQTGQSGQVTINQGTEQQDAQTINATIPSSLRQGPTPVTFTAKWDNPSTDALRNTRFDVILYGDDTATQGLTASQVHLSYADESTGGAFRSVPLTDDTINDGEIDGSLPPLTGFTFPANHTRTTTFRLSVDTGAPTSVQTGLPLTVELDFNKINPADGFTTTLDNDNGDLWIAPPAPACTSTVTGATPSSYTVPAGQTVCFNGATINGSLTVPSGTGAVVTKSTITGSVLADGAKALSLCGSTVSNSVSVSNSTGFVVLGDPTDDSCAADTVQGSVILNGNHGDAELVGNHIDKSVSVDNTSGHGPFADDRAAEIESNTIGKSLECSGNTPVPTNDGHANTVSGSRLGQCSAAGF